ncbi:hypothetical protein DOTSEDRAFT_39891 [Dothistroma septosporum NZE10]|uniref:DNA recombination and repair protein Rad51-like C-terminal domain-containing protein n=1 Tax=Dothistroma septosporum (strain NZE10 / CBS 128990) TaxID=675120 RepID=N1PYQ4_DOTSN|nr:hypothetical protein DOTSEDRAFT_39891 [Dothistroma septosporum NZE10]
MATIAPPETAFDLWQPLAGKHDNVDNHFDEDVKPMRLATGVRDIDSAFDGGFDYGVVHCITSQPDHGIKELVQGLICSCICSSPRATAKVIDSTLSFDVRRLFQVLQASMKDCSEQQTLEVLDHVKITKVFDHVGATEGLAELEERVKIDALAAAELPQGAVQVLPKSTIEDSDDDEADMLDSHPKLDNAAPEEPSVDGFAGSPPGALLVIDNISQLFQPIIKNNYIHGQALLAQFMRTVTLLTRRHGFCTVIVSSAAAKTVPEDERLSLFESCDFRPALGDELGYLMDVHFYLHQILAKRVGEARVQGEHPESVSMLEVISDQARGRYGRYAAFTCNADGTLEDVP